MVLLCIFISPVSEAMNMSANPDYVIMLALTVAIDAFTAMPFAYLRYQNRAMRFAVVRLINIGVNIGLNLFFLFLFLAHLLFCLNLCCLMCFALVLNMI